MTVHTSTDRHWTPTPAPAPGTDLLRGPGNALAEPARADLEQRYGHDFSQVRVHAADEVDEPAGLASETDPEPADQSGGSAGAGRRWTALGVVRQLGSDRHVIRSLLRLRYRILSFRTAFDRWRYQVDGRTEEQEVTGLRGNTCRERGRFCPQPRRIRLRESLTDQQAASTLYHESQHAILGRPAPPETGLDQEIEVRVRTERHLIRRGLPPAVPGYRRPDGTVDRAAIRRSIERSRHYNPRDRTRIGRRYVDDRVVWGWRRALRIVRRESGP